VLATRGGLEAPVREPLPEVLKIIEPTIAARRYHQDLMSPTSQRILACVLLLVQAMASIGAGRTICIPLDDCVHDVTSSDARARTLHACCDHHDHAACGDAAGGPATPVEPSASDPDCGCHLHLPLPERVDPISTGVTVVPPIMLPTTPCRITEPCTTGPTVRVSPRRADDAWLGSAEVRARSVTSLQV